MKTVIMDVRPLKGALEGFKKTWRTGRAEKAARISFATPQLLWSVLTERRWELLQAMAGKGAMSLRAAARLVERDVKQVHGDVHALLGAGVLERTQDGKLQFPYQAVHVDFVLEAA